jgi:hypothetical protein
MRALAIARIPVLIATTGDTDTVYPNLSKTTTPHSRDDYQRALDSNERAALQSAYDRAMYVAFDLRHKQTTRETAREFLPQLGKQLRAVLETIIEVTYENRLE